MHLVTNSLRLFNRFFVEKMMLYFSVKHIMHFFEAGELRFCLIWNAPIKIHIKLFCFFLRYMKLESSVVLLFHPHLKELLCFGWFCFISWVETLQEYIRFSSWQLPFNRHVLSLRFSRSRDIFLLWPFITLLQFICLNCLSVFDYLVGLALKGLITLLNIFSYISKLQLVI